jgi:hypothetical protein
MCSPEKRDASAISVADAPRTIAATCSGGSAEQQREKSMRAAHVASRDATAVLRLSGGWRRSRKWVALYLGGADSDDARGDGNPAGVDDDQRCGTRGSGICEPEHTAQLARELIVDLRTARRTRLLYMRSRATGFDLGACVGNRQQCRDGRAQREHERRDSSFQTGALHEISTL